MLLQLVDTMTAEGAAAKERKLSLYSSRDASMVEGYFKVRTWTYKS